MNTNTLLPEGYSINMTKWGWELSYQGEHVTETLFYSDAFSALKEHHGMHGRERTQNATVILDDISQGHTTKLLYDKTWKDYSVERNGMSLFRSEDEMSALNYYIDMVTSE